MRWGKYVTWCGLAAVILVVGYGALQRGYCWWAGWWLMRETHYAPFVGCLIDGKDGKRIPLTSIREME